MIEYSSYNNVFTEDEDDLVRLDQLKEFLEFYRLDQYFAIFVQEGFDRLLSLFDITEFDLISLNVKRGHRRLLQRAIATARGIPIHMPIVITYGLVSAETLNSSHSNGAMEASSSGSGNDNMPAIVTAAPSTLIAAANPPQHYQVETPSSHRTTSGGSASHKLHHSLQRKHRRRKAQYVPARPITAFDDFVRRVRSDRISDNESTSFSSTSSTDIINLAYDRWQRLSAEEKEIYEREALLANANSSGVYSSNFNDARGREDEENEIDWYNIEYYQQRYHRNHAKDSSSSSSSTSTSSSHNNNPTFLEIDGRVSEQVD